MPDPKDIYRLYMENAREMLEVAGENLGNEHYTLAKEDVVMAVAKAQEFVEEVEKWLRKNELL